MALQRMTTFSADPALPLAGRIALITGANTGIGRVTARELARQGATVFIASLSQARTQPVLDEIAALPGTAPARWIALDLGDFASVRGAVQQFLETGLPLHLLVNNAGVAGQRGLTRSGFEMAFGINHLGHFLLTQMLMPRLRDSAPARVVVVGSKAHRRVPGLSLEHVRERTRSRTGVAEYANSKLANLLFSAELGRRMSGCGVSSYAVHPGVVASDIWRVVPRPLQPLLHWVRRMKNVEEGAQTSVYCATAPDIGTQTGLYWDESHPVQPSEGALDELMAAELWKHSEAWTA